MIPRRQLAHMARRAVVESARRHGVVELVAYCGRIVKVDNLDAGRSIRVCRVCAQVAAEAEAWGRGGAA